MSHQGSPAVQPPEGMAFWGDLHQFSLVTPYHLLIDGVNSAVGAAAAAGSSAAHALTAFVVESLVQPAAGATRAYLDQQTWTSTLNMLMCVIIVLACIVYYPPRPLFAWVTRQRWAQGVLFHFPVSRRDKKTSKKFICLTMDDGPCPYNTLSILDVLREHGARATHFIIGSHVEQCDRVGAGIGRVQFGRLLMHQMLADGHELGNHTWWVHVHCYADGLQRADSSGGSHAPAPPPATFGSAMRLAHAPGSSHQLNLALLSYGHAGTTAPATSSLQMSWRRSSGQPASCCTRPRKPSRAVTQPPPLPPLLLLSTHLSASGGAGSARATGCGRARWCAWRNGWATRLCWARCGRTTIRLACPCSMHCTCGARSTLAPLWCCTTGVFVVYGLCVYCGGCDSMANWLAGLACAVGG